MELSEGRERERELLAVKNIAQMMHVDDDDVAPDLVNVAYRSKKGGGDMWRGEEELTW